jgi:pantoate--beta-alanine ligase
MSVFMLLRSKEELENFLQDHKGSLGFVPTMGALHQGHGTLVARSAKENETTVVSVFVNPKQFGPKEDFSRYPRTLDSDMALAQAMGASAVYAPSVEEIYPPDWRTSIEVEGITELLCGKFRPGHFRGVATVVYRLFQLVNPQRAYLGEKDFQQCLVIERMVADLGLSVKVIRGATERNSLGLALSSRNRYLSSEAQERASGIFRALRATREAAQGGEKVRPSLEQLLRSQLGSIAGFSIQYAEILDGPLLTSDQEVSLQGRAFVAGFLEGVRLIDNLPLFE